MMTRLQNSSGVPAPAKRFRESRFNRKSRSQSWATTIGMVMLGLGSFGFLSEVSADEPELKLEQEEFIEELPLPKPSKEPAKSEETTKGNRSRASDGLTRDSQRSVSSGATSQNHYPAPIQNPSYGGTPIVASPIIPQTACGNHACQNYNSACGLPVADRDGHGTIDEIHVRLGIGPHRSGFERWQCPHETPFCLFGPGEYAGPARTTRLAEYRLRPGDSIQFMYLITELKSNGAYRLSVGDELLIEAEADESLTRGSLERGLTIQPDGTITLRFIGQVFAAGRSVKQLRDELEERYKEFYDEPAIDVTPISTGSAALAIRNAISGNGGFDPQLTTQTVTPNGDIRLPKIGRVIVQGLSLEELKQEINLRYDSVVGGIEVEPSLISQAPHNIFVLGEVAQPGRFGLGDTPTTVLGAIAMAGGHLTGANLRQVVVFRRDENWRLVSTLLDLRAAILGREAHPRDEIFIRDGDVIILPSTPIRLFDNFVRQVFTEGIYGIFPFTTSYNIGNNFNGN